MRNVFPEHEEAPTVLGAAADDLYEMKDYTAAIESASLLIERYPNTAETLLRSAWIVVANSSIDIADFANAEHAYTEVCSN